MDLYVVGHLVRNDKQFAWRLVSVCTERHKAESMCESTVDFVRQIEANQKIDQTVRPANIYFPAKAKK